MMCGKCGEFGHKSRNWPTQENNQGHCFTGRYWLCRKQAHMTCYCKEIKQGMIAKKKGNFEKVKVAVN